MKINSMKVDRLIEYRKLRGFSQEEMGEKLGVKRTTYAGYEQGRRSMDDITLMKVAQILKVNPEYLTGRSDSPVLTLEKSDEISIDALKEMSEKLLYGNVKGDVPKEIAREIAKYLMMQIKDIEEKRTDTTR